MIMPFLIPTNAALWDYDQWRTFTLPSHVVPAGAEAHNLKPEYHGMYSSAPLGLAHLVERFGPTNPFRLGSGQAVCYAYFLTAMTSRQVAGLNNLPEISDTVLVKRRINQPRIVLPLDNVRDAKLRLQNALIFVGSRLFMVKDVCHLDNELALVVANADGNKFRVRYSHPGLDLRSPEPQYISTSGDTVYCYRAPLRQQRQGLSTDSIGGRRAGTGERISIHPAAVMKAVDQQDVMWQSNLADVMLKGRALSCIRLSKDIVFFTPNYKDLHAEYRGRRLGDVHEDRVVVSSKDGNRSWIDAAIKQIGCTSKVING